MDGEFSVNTQIGEKEQSYPVVLALTKKVGEKEQRIIVTGDADCISNGELSTKRNGIGSANFDFITESFKWLSYGEFPIETFRPEPTDNSINISRKASPWIKTTAMGIIPCILLFTGGRQDRSLYLRRQGFHADGETFPGIEKTWKILS